MKVYIASPFGFAESTREFYYSTIMPAIRRAFKQDILILDPWTLTRAADIFAAAVIPYGQERKDAWKKLNVEIANNNRQAIDACDAVFACLDGVDVDSGTASEIGYAYAKGKLIVGYRNDFRLCGDNDGAAVNLQVEYFILQSGGDIFTDVGSAAAALTSKGNIV